MKSELDKAIQVALEASLNTARNAWIGIAQKELKSSREAYINAITGVEVSPGRGSISLVGDFPCMIEEGFAPYDMKDGFSRSSYRKKGRSGQWYMRVPFRHYTSGHTNVMPKKVLNLARKLQNGEIIDSSILRDLGVEPGISWTGYAHRATKYDGLRRVVKDYGKTKRSTYQTFRTVSENSPGNSWIHPGYKGLKALDKVEEEAENAFRKALGV